MSSKGKGHIGDSESFMQILKNRVWNFIKFITQGLVHFYGFVVLVELQRFSDSSAQPFTLKKYFIKCNLYLHAVAFIHCN